MPKCSYNSFMVKLQYFVINPLEYYHVINKGGSRYLGSDKKEVVTPNDNSRYK